MATLNHVRPAYHSQVSARLLTVEHGKASARDDLLATEEPLEIRVTGGAPVITLRTPGYDLELAAGLLLSEGVIRRRDDLIALHHAPDRHDMVRVVLQSSIRGNVTRLERSSLSNSACGVCGKTKLNLEPLAALPPLPPGPTVGADVVAALPERLRAAQCVFRYTGGLHAAALFDAHGELRAVCEDVGRHNAMDKLCGWAMLNDQLPLHEHLVLFSGRASYELLQKAIMARIPFVCAISAPSSLAVRLAQDFGVTLVGFLRGARFNVYSWPHRIAGLEVGELAGVERPLAEPSSLD